MATRIRYKDYYITHIFSVPEMTFEFQHEGYDGAPDSNDNRAGHGTSIPDCVDQIDFIIEEENWVRDNPEEYARQLEAIANRNNG